MKQFKFRLNGLLKLREFREHKAKMELGQINQALSDVKNELAKLNRNIDEGYLSQEKMLQQPTPARLMQFYPYFSQGIREHIKKLYIKLGELNKSYDQKMLELNRLKGDVDIIEKLKEKERVKFMKVVEKKMEENIQDTVLMNQFRKTLDDGQ